MAWPRFNKKRLASLVALSALPDNPSRADDDEVDGELDGLFADPDGAGPASKRQRFGVKLLAAWLLARRAPRRDRKEEFRGTEEADPFNWDDQYFVQQCRFTKADLRRLAAALRLPNIITTSNGQRRSREFALCVTTRRLSYAGRWVDLEATFAADKRLLQGLFAQVIEVVVREHEHRILTLDTERIAPRLAEFAQAIQNEGSPLPNVWGFLDGKFFGMCKPSRGQEAQYNRYKRGHGLAEMGLQCPDGILAIMYGPEDGRHHDSYVLGKSGLLDQLDAHACYTDFVLFADKGYAINNHIIVAYEKPFTNDT